MPVEKKLFSSGAMAKELGVTPAKLKKIIEELKIEPAEKKGVCSYYTEASLNKIKKKI